METSKDVKMNSAIEGVGNVLVGMMKGIISSGCSELRLHSDYQNALRVESLRSSILAGNRYNLEEMCSLLQMHDSSIERLANELVLSVEVVKRAKKRFYYF
jgi:hypothetical protein